MEDRVRPAHERGSLRGSFTLKLFRRRVILDLSGLGPAALAVTTMKIRWHDEPQKHDYPAAQNYLALLMEPHLAKQAAADLKDAGMAQFAAKDIFRASGLSLLGVSNSHGEADRTKIILKEELSPLLLLAGARDVPLIIADGYHR